MCIIKPSYSATPYACNNFSSLSSHIAPAGAEAEEVF